MQFLIFSFLFPPANPRWIFNFFLSIHCRVFAGKFHSQHSRSRYCLCIWCASACNSEGCNNNNNNNGGKMWKSATTSSTILIHFKIHSHSLYLPQKFPLTFVVKIIFLLATKISPRCELQQHTKKCNEICFMFYPLLCRDFSP